MVPLSAENLLLGIFQLLCIRRYLLYLLLPCAETQLEVFVLPLPCMRVAETLGLIGAYTLPSTNMNEVVRNGIYGCNGTNSSWRNLPELSNGILIVFCTGGRILQLYAIAAGAKLFCRHGYKSSSWTFVGWTEIK